MLDEFSTLIRHILDDRSPPPLPEAFAQNELTSKAYADLMRQREILQQFAKGYFDETVDIRGAIAGCLKTLQANLRHLAWQVHQVAEGDYTQRVDFMGDFSTAFNSMVVQLERSVTMLKERETSLLEKTDELQFEIAIRHQVEKVLRLSEERWKTAVECSCDGIWDINLETKEAWYSPRFFNMFQFEYNDIPAGNRWDLLVHPDDSDAARSMGKILSREVPPHEFMLEYRTRRKNGEYIWVQTRAKPVNEENRNPVRMIGVTSDISLQKETEKTLAYQATHDRLTGLPNRYLLDDRLEQHLAQARRGHSSFILVALDLDNFKQVNDTWGHSAGDKLLIEFGRKIRACLRDTDTVARIGGDEFIFIYPCQAGKEKATTESVMNRLYAEYQKPILFGETSYTLRSSAGVSFFPLHTADKKKLFELADEALYKAKAKGKNTYAIWEAAK